jgi:hypothetical protein
MIQVDSSKTRSGLRNLKAGLHQAAVLTLRAGLAAAESSAKGSTLFHDRSGATRASIHASGVIGLRGFVEARGAMLLLESGTRAHTIRARGQTLRFVSNGVTIYRRAVRHPGTKSRPVMATARRAAEQAIWYGSELYVGHAIKNVRG